MNLICEALQQGVHGFFRHRLMQDFIQEPAEFDEAGDAAEPDVIIHQRLSLIVVGAVAYCYAVIGFRLELIGIEYDTVAIEHQGLVLLQIQRHDWCPTESELRTQCPGFLGQLGDTMPFL